MSGSCVVFMQEIIIRPNLFRIYCIIGEQLSILNLKYTKKIKNQQIVSFKHI